MLSTCEGEPAEAPESGGERSGSVRENNGNRGAEGRGEKAQEVGTQEWEDGSRYEGDFMDGLKHGKGRYTWRNGEYYDGSFYKDYKHGTALYVWPTGHRFIGKFYLNKREGYGQQVFPGGACFKGLYRADQRFGPGVLTDPGGCEDVGLWLGHRLIKLCTPVEDSFSLKSLPEYAACMNLAAAVDDQTQPPRVDINGDFLPDEDFALPLGLDTYSTVGDHLPLPPGQRRVFDQHFYGELWEHVASAPQSYERDLLCSLPLQARMEAHIHQDRLQAETLDWDVAAVLSLNRDPFGPKGPDEIRSELFIQSAFRGELEPVSQMLQIRSVHPDVADSNGHTALIAATVNCHNDVINLLLDFGADVDKLNSDGMSALAVCFVLYYPYHSLDTILMETPVKTQVLKSMSVLENSREDNPALGNQSHQSDQLSPGTLASPHSQKACSFDQSEILNNQNVRICNSSKSSELSAELKDVGDKERVQDVSLQQTEDEESTCQLTSDPAGSISDYKLDSTDKVMSQRGVDRCSKTQEASFKMDSVKSKLDRSVRQITLKLLMQRGANPNVSKVPMPLLFLAIMAAVADAVRSLLQAGAPPDIPFPPERKGLYPLHVAAALQGPAGPAITEMLLHTIADPDSEACDQNEIFKADGASTPTRIKEDIVRSGGRTALHIACQREKDHRNASKVVALLLAHRARTDLLWSGHSPLSLAIACGNDWAVEELLNGGADPNLPLGPRVSSALCALSNINYQMDSNKAKLLKMLAQAGADILMPVKVGEVIGNALDYARHSFNQDIRITYTPLNALNIQERETLILRRQLLSLLEDLLRKTASQRQPKSLDKKQQPKIDSESVISTSGPRCKSVSANTDKHSSKFKFCFHCGRSMYVKLTICSRCRKVFFCSQSCKLRAWEEGHGQECVWESVSGTSAHRMVEYKSKGGPRPSATSLKPATVPKPQTVKLKHQRVPEPMSKAAAEVNLKENYSYI